MPGDELSLVGSWARLTDSPCSRVYPRSLQLLTGGLYSGTGMEPGDAPGWDTGVWQVVSPTRVRLSAINDAIITYEFSLAGDKLTFVAPDGCVFRYRRVS